MAMNLSLALDESDTQESPLRNKPARPQSPRRSSPIRVIDLTDSPPPSPKVKANLSSSPPLLGKIALLREQHERSGEESWEPTLSPVRTSPRKSPNSRRFDDLPHETHSDPETPVKPTKRKSSDEEDDLLEPLFSFSSQPLAKKAVTEVVRKTAKDLVEDKKKRKEEEKLEKAAQKEREKQQRKKEKEKYRKRTKEEAAAEMVVKIDRRVVDSPRGAEILSQLQKICTASLADLPVSGLIEWRRGKSYELEKVLVLRMMGKQFAELASGGPDAELKPLIMQIQQQHAHHKLIFLLEGFQEYLRSERVKAQAEYKRRIANHEMAAGSVYDQRVLGELKLLLEDTVLWLEVDRQCQVWQTETSDQSAAWLCTLTTQLGLLPYKYSHLVASFPFFVNTAAILLTTESPCDMDSRVACLYLLSFASFPHPQTRPKASFETFCAEAAQKRTYGTPLELWQQQLECINGVSSDVAKAISRAYPTMGSLLRVYASEVMTEKAKKELLRQVPLLGADGQAGSKYIGPALSEKIYRLFTSTNPDEVL